MTNSSESWFQQGLRFKCTGCGKCCTGTPGYVWLLEEEIDKMAEFLQISREDFVKKYTRQVGNRLALKEVKRNQDYDCTFLKGKQCTIYGVRPKQCQTFPWWQEHLSSKEAWEEAAQGCEGINHPEAPLISIGEIKDKML